MAALNLGGKWLGCGSWKWQGKPTMLCPQVEGGHRGDREREEKWHLVASPCLSDTVQSWPVHFISLRSYICQSLLSSFFSNLFSCLTCWGCQIHFCVVFLLPSPPSTLTGYLSALLWASHSVHSYSNTVLFQSLLLSHHYCWCLFLLFLHGQAGVKELCTWDCVTNFKNVWPDLPEEGEAKGSNFEKQCY